MIDIMDLSPSKAIEVFTHSAANIATQAFMIENSGRSPEDMTPEEWDEDTPAAENCKQVAESFRDFILTHTNKANEECMAAIGAGMIIFMTRVNAHLDGVTDRTAFDFLNKVTTYSMMTESNWGEACDEILGSA